ncbi:hypothetical protein BJ138DRAFT_1149746 [Hygrophoropsis aurantiaca]|uniref:Uncharacterized protein n=1 Tax=Hygrophoropsis aurantiaca TaxID=72124 RepID=A0ACB8AFC3_9AGAM|nr:hypothetical protein BJ138DRAFT_1149746 [Hygrophoropsis aurantiaca]
MRELVHYEDISQPQSSSSSAIRDFRPPPPKKRKRLNQKSHQQPRNIQHWDDPGYLGEPMVYDEATGEPEPSLTMNEDGQIQEEEGESQELTHDEIWDDSALIDAWNSATAEYEAYHGPSQSWKAQPVKKSPLWYNTPFTNKRLSKEATAPSSSSNAKPQDGAPVENEDSSPLDFNTFIPTHDPSLPTPTEPPVVQNDASPSYFIPDPPTSMVSQDEAFSRALSAMYWGGYWTAVYHHQSLARQITSEVAEEEVEPSDELEDLVPAQR